MHRDTSPRLSLAAPEVTTDVLVRELAPPDAEVLAQAATEVAFVKGRIGVPGSTDDARAELERWSAARQRDEGNIFGLFTPDGGTLAGVMSLLLTDDFVAEAAAWSRSDSRARETTAAGMAVVVHLAHRRMGLIRVWATIDPADPFTKYLGHVAGFAPEGEVREPDGTLHIRYSSIG